MRLRKIVFMLAMTSSSFVAFGAPADLVTVYQQAVNSDPTFKEAYANYQIAQDNVPLSRSDLLPQISLTGEDFYQDTRTRQKNGETINGSVEGVQNTRTRNRSYQYELQLTQQIFNYTDWENLASASTSAKSAFATYTAAIQNLIVRTSQAYFNVLKAKDNLILTQAEARAFQRQYIQAKESYEVGVKTLTDVENAKAQYDSSRADVVAADNSLMDSREDLRAITNVYYPELQGLKRLPLVKPVPADINAWVDKAQQRSWTLLAARYTLIAAGYNIKSAEGGHMPTVSLTSSYQNEYDHTLNQPNTNGRTLTFQAGLNVSMPIYSGGQVSASVDQSVDQYRLASSQLEASYRQILNDTRQSYLGAISGISKVNADYQAIISNESSLKGTEEGYKVGTQTMLNVLQAEKNLYQAKKQYSNDRYDYIMSLINLKAAAGTLSVSDVGRINAWLLSPVPPAAHHTKKKVAYAPVVRRHASKPAVKRPLVHGKQNTVNATPDKVQAPQQQ